MAGTRRGRPPKGDRVPMHVRVPRDHREIYEAGAAAAGLPLGDYVAVQLALAHELEEPSYVHRGKDSGQPELAIPA